MGKKRAFLDKKHATTYSVVHRSQQDGAYGVEERPSDFVLLEQRRPNVRVKDAVTHSEEELGFANDGYDYEQHLRKMGGGQFIDASGAVSDTAGKALVPREAMTRDDIEEIPRMYEAVTLTAEQMDVQMAAALFDDAAFDDLEELEDDFVVEASKVDPNAAHDFDYDAHIAALLGNLNTAGGGGHDHDDDDDECTDHDEDKTVVVDHRAPKAGDVDDAFEAALEGYDDSDDEEDPSDDYDLSDDEDPSDGGGAPQLLVLDGQVLEGMLDEAISQLKRDVAAEARVLDPPNRGEVLVPRLCEASDEPAAEDAAAVDAAIDAEYDEIERRRLAKEERFDCETILSTLSNLDNHFSTLRDADDEEDARRRARRAQQEQKKRRLPALDEGRGGAPASAAARNDDDAVHGGGAAPSGARVKGESKADKAARKAAVKAERRDRRLDKKERKAEWKEAECRIPAAHSAAPSVFTF